MSNPKQAPTFNIDDAVTFRISRLFSKLNTGVARQLNAQFKLLSREWRALALVAQHEPISASELVERSPMDKASVSRAVSRLTELGYISTLPHPEDGRMQTIRLTRSGWTIYRRIAPHSAARQASLLSVLSAPERKAFFAMLDRIEEQAARLFGGDATPLAPVVTGRPRPKKQNKSLMR